MRDELSGIAEAIERSELPASADELFGSMWSVEDQRFVSQETYVLDFKDRAPADFSKGYGAAIIRLALGFYNSFGGIIVFGVADTGKTLCGLSKSLDVEALSDVVTGLTEERIEFVGREYKMTGTEDRVFVLLVPRRGVVRPATLKMPLDKYPVGTVWVRDRHSVRELDETFIPLLYSDRSDLTRSVSSDAYRSIHNSLPESPATMQKFIGRKDLLLQLWDWLVFDSKPRIYLHGPGGSGKSTLAYEFSKQVTERGQSVEFPGKGCLDYVVWISGKETELNPQTATEQPFALRRFDDALSQYKAILVDSGAIPKSEAELLDEGESLIRLKELFNTYSGLIIIDDVDALSRRNKDTGEENLFFTLMGNSKTTKVLYTLRYPPPSALSSSRKVPELDGKEEFALFVHACSSQLQVPPPTTPEILKVAEATSRLPLLIETVIGLRKVCGSYPAALDQFRERGGESARQYLYQREYDRLEPKGRSREVLAALLLLDEAVPFSVIAQILNIDNALVRDAISECGSIFLSAVDTGKGETQYNLATPAKPYISNVSLELKHFGTVKRRVELFLAEDADFTPEESALIVQLSSLVRARRYQDAADIYEGRSRNDPVITNQRVQSLVGQAYANLGPNYRTKARECFKAASSLGHSDVFMARAWFHVESSSQVGTKEAIQVCESFLAKPGRSARDRAEFQSKLANCYHEHARRLRSVSQEKTIEAYTKSIQTYILALRIGKDVDQFDGRTIRWLQVPSVELVQYIGADLEPFFSLIDALTSQKRDVPLEGAEVLMQALSHSRAARSDKERNKIAGVLRRTLRKLDKRVVEDPDAAGSHYLASMLATLHAGLSRSIPAT
jgi:hypothetical protein